MSARADTLIRVPFLDLWAQHRSIASELEPAMARVIESGTFVLGPEVEAFERAFAAHTGVRECVGVSSGTAALQIALMAIGLEAGGEVILPSHTFTATAEAVLWAGGRPVLVDVCEGDFNLSPAAVKAAITPRTRGVIPVHLYGQPAAMGEILEIAKRNGLFVLEDACQAHGAAVGSEKVGTFGHAAAFSFYPGKNLGAYGEGGAIVTRDAEVARKARMLRDHGQSSKHVHALLGHNYRMEALQGAVLGAKLRHLDRWNLARRQIAGRYREALGGLPLRLPFERDDAHHVYHLFVVRSERRDALRSFLEARGVQTLIHYPTPLHRQPVLIERGCGGGDFPVAERVSAEIVSLPLYPELPEPYLSRVCGAISEFFQSPEGLA